MKRWFPAAGITATLVGLLVGTPDAGPRVLEVAPPGPVLPGQALSVGPGRAEVRVARVEGWVRTPDGAAVAGALVALSRPGEAGFATAPPGGGPAPEDPAAAVLEVIARSDRRGHFELPEVEPGRHVVTASAPGFGPGRGEIEVKAGGPGPVEISLGGAEAAFEVQGQVQAQTVGVRPQQTVGVRPVPGALVQAVASEGGIVVAFTGEAGQFQLPLPAGHHVLWFGARGLVRQRRDIELHADQRIGVQLFAGARIAGSVVSAAGAPSAAGTLVNAVAAETGSRPRQVRADAQGRFAFDDLEPGRYVIWARQGAWVGFHSEPLPLALGDQARGVDVALRRAATVTGRILDDRGAPIAGVRIRLLPSPRSDLGFGSGQGSAISARDGRYTIAGVLAGQYRLRAEAAARAPGETREIAVSDGADQILNADLRLGAAPGPGRGRDAGGRPAFIRGHVRWHDGAPAAGVRVHWLPARGGRDSTAVVGKDGSYQLGPLPASLGRCQAEYPSDPVAGLGAPTLGGLGRGRQQRLGLDLAPGQQRNDVDLVLLRDDQIIAGQLHGPDGRPIAGALVWASQLPGGEWNEAESGRPRAVSDRDGRFVILGVPAGEYEVRAMHPRFPLARKSGVIAGSEAVQIGFEAPAWLSGQLLDAGAAPAGPVHVAMVEALAPGSPTHTLFNQAGSRHWVFQGDRGGAGLFTIGPLAPGEYHLLVHAAAGTGRVSGIKLTPSYWRQEVRVSLGPGASARADQN